VSIRTAVIEDIPSIRAIALRTWPIAYGGILPPAQLAYMLDLMYSEAALADQLNVKGHHFALFEVSGEVLGFAGYEHHHYHRACTRLHKLYVMPSMQRTGAGKALLQHVIASARSARDVMVELNVNRFNNARWFYEKIGFRVVRDEVIDIGQGFVMDDHVMELPIP